MNPILPGVAAMAALAVSTPADAVFAPAPFEVEEVADGVYVFFAMDTTHDWVHGNSTAIITEAGVIVIDAPAVRFSEAQLAFIRERTDAPVRYLINTHWHYDHMMGNQVFADAFPDLQIIMQARGGRMADLRNEAVFNAYFNGEGRANLLREARDGAAREVDDDGKSLSAYEKKRAKRSLGEIEAALTGVGDFRYVGPTVTFENAMSIRLGGRRLELAHWEGHSRGDLTVLLPDENVLVTGDLLIHPSPYGVRSFFDEWTHTLARLPEADVYVPGHGAVLRDRRYIELESALFTSLMAQARDAVREGLSLEAFQTRLDLEEFRRAIVGGDPEKAWGWENYFMAAAPARAFSIARGET